VFQDPRLFPIDERDLVDGCVLWFRRFTWDWSARLNFREPPSASRANRLFMKWTLRIEQEDGTDLLRWVRIPEKDIAGEIRGFSVLVGALRSKDARRWLRLWPAHVRSAHILSSKPDDTHGRGLGFESPRAYEQAPVGWVYILQSLSTGRFYVGSTADLERRLAKHQRRHSPATRGREPWRLVYQEPFPSLIAARRREGRAGAHSRHRPAERPTVTLFPGLRHPRLFPDGCRVVPVPIHQSAPCSGRNSRPPHLASIS
jgi:putative endonuclease